MIYTVEIDFASQQHFAEWNAWYHGNLPLILTVPGFATAQRLEAVGRREPRFLAIYTISDENVFESEAYRAVGGGGTASSRWKEFIKRRRNLYSGMDIVPEITQDALLGVVDTDPGPLDPPDLLFIPLVARALAKFPQRRFVTILNDPTRLDYYARIVPDLHFYKPLGPRLTSDLHRGRRAK